MNIEEERKAFELAYKHSRDYKFYIRHEMSEKQIFELKNNKYDVGCVNEAWLIWCAAWQASANREGFVLIKNDSRTVVAIENMVQQQVEASGITDDIFRLDGDRILEAMLSAQEQSNESN